MPLEPLDFLNGMLGLVFITITIILGIIICSKYFKTYDKNFLLVGITLIFLVSGWYGTSFSFLVALIFNNEGLSYEMIMLLNFVPLPIALFTWMTAFTNFLYKEKQKFILAGSLAYIVFFFVLFFYFLFNQPEVIGEKISPVDTKANNIVFVIILIGLLVTLLITGIKFSIETIKLGKLETKLKGKLLFVAFISFCVGGFLDATLPTIAITLIIFRVILISSSIEFYGGFILPKWMKKALLKNELTKE
ncbi:MAG: hypothetical protein GF353_16135 [Candidatus Lokiarchaeota archaeon]|nr:hypothetical protein [Candidatus Lokiarchaeota archaeon]